MHQGRIIASYNCSVFQLYCRAAVYSFVTSVLLYRFFCRFPCRFHNGSVFWIKVEIVHKQFDSLYRFCFGKSHDIFTTVTEIPTDNFLFCRLFCQIIIDDGKTGSIHTHISGRFVERYFARNLFKNSFQNRKYFNVTVIIHTCLSVCFQVKRIDLVEIANVGCSRFIRDVHRMFKG